MMYVSFHFYVLDIQLDIQLGIHLYMGIYPHSVKNRC